MFGDALDLAPIRVLACPPGWNRAFVPGRWFWRDWIVYPARDAFADFAAAPLGAQRRRSSTNSSTSTRLRPA